MAMGLAGWVVKYADYSPGHRERIAPGALRLVRPNVSVSVHHNRARLLGRVTRNARLVWRREGLRIEVAELATSEWRDALVLVRAGVMLGWSIEMAWRAVPIPGGRLVVRGMIDDIALVGRPSYPLSLAEIVRL